MLLTLAKEIFQSQNKNIFCPECSRLQLIFLIFEGPVKVKNRIIILDSTKLIIQLYIIYWNMEKCKFCCHRSI